MATRKKIKSDPEQILYGLLEWQKIAVVQAARIEALKEDNSRLEAENAELLDRCYDQNERIVDLLFKQEVA